ncbi:hypothetical protein Back2_11100 [Nocardioides baekrokdamisoli]|uniref:MmpS family membrane protein n=1 Tax=Nocardioides baekrokdamisoli TaxID=1804624 RepID=A0A3G9IWT4_9ACTN|nr:MmpS family transport accessory protein [Nocardioides baekrokdamisoli]BBH16823.1 hypothetical protein Back2_11100 [Nocardioides baekrokdamisoli]
MSDAPQPPQAPQTIIIKQKSHFFRNCLFVLLAGVAAIVVIVVVIVSGAKKAIDTANNTSHKVEYIAGGTAGSASLTFTTDGSTSTSQLQDQKLPWNKALNIKGDLLAVYQLMVQNTNMNSGNSATVTCEIKVDGKSVIKNQSSGVGAIASCDYTK